MYVIYKRHTFFAENSNVHLGKNAGKHLQEQIPNAQHYPTQLRKTLTHILTIIIYQEIFPHTQNLKSEINIFGNQCIKQKEQTKRLALLTIVSLILQIFKLCDIVS